MFCLSQPRDEHLEPAGIPTQEVHPDSDLFHSRIVTDVIIKRLGDITTIFARGDEQRRCGLGIDLGFPVAIPADTHR